MYKFFALCIFTVYWLAAGAAQNGPSGCVLPPYPPHGTYTVYDKPDAIPGQTYDFAILTVSCDPGYGVVGRNGTQCFSANIWLHPLPQCTHEREICQPNQILCNNGRCVLKSWVCDGQDDCRDGSDEQNCPAPLPGEPCAPTQYTCADKQCIQRSFHCDERKDCKDSSDELGCLEPYISKDPHPSCVELKPGESLNLQCEAVGVPVPVIVWYHDWSHVPRKCVSNSVNGVGTLSCPDMQPDDAGMYVCEALALRSISIFSYDAVVHVNTTNACPS